MNKRNFVYNYTPLKKDFDALQNDMEGGIKDVAQAVAGMGILSGLNVSISGSEATISPGVAYDGRGNRIATDVTYDDQGNRVQTNALLTVFIGKITRPSSGRFKWVTLALRYKVKEYGNVLDGNGMKWPAQLLDSYSTHILEGDEGEAGNAASKPAYEDWEVPLLDIRVDATSPWKDLLTETNRRPVLIPIAKASSKLVQLDTQVTEHEHANDNPHGVTKDQVGLGHVPNWFAGNNYIMGRSVNKFASESGIKRYVESMFPVGMTYAQYPQGKTPSAMGWPGTWQAQFETEGVFFRTPGYYAYSFGGGRQEDELKSHSHRYRSYYWGYGQGKTKSGIFGSKSGDTDSTGYAETRPRNYTFRVWRRIY